MLLGNVPSASCTLLQSCSAPKPPQALGVFPEVSGQNSCWGQRAGCPHPAWSPSPGCSAAKGAAPGSFQGSAQALRTVGLNFGYFQAQGLLLISAAQCWPQLQDPDRTAVPKGGFGVTREQLPLRRHPKAGGCSIHRAEAARHRTDLQQHPKLSDGTARGHKSAGAEQ